MTLPRGIRVAWREVASGMPRREVSRALLAELLPGARIDARCARCGGAHGRVRISGAEAAASVSYVAGWAVVATAPAVTVRAIGVDAVTADAEGLDRVLTGGARAWARVEAVLKADGRGLEVDPARVTVDEHDDGWRARLDDGSAFDGLDLDGPDGAIVAVAVVAADGRGPRT